ncbi:NADH dehydrogenase (ubiquinone) Fe-S protein 6 [Limimonas halophila]|uniref:NADH dehydrogenase (Ubiquinone) Fe-S protein 6 n=1 Tax=Limimonas halophila TaxID=1082479 RepID=A0A1G7S8P9_9PROT|nr:zinc-finger domain-containing protein [Limimonas halophila]SDG18809.1 NADH dehydrogenase (ubiquinone) Fe-S protein 6 [Limimonas halophila]
MAEPTEVVYVDREVIACDGGTDPSLGHPRVFLNMNTEDGLVDCPYCSRRFVLKDGAKVGHGH